MRIDETAGVLRVSERGDVVCEIDADGWSQAGPRSDAANAPGIDRPVATTVAGRTDRLRFPPGRVDHPLSGTGRSGVGNRETTPDVPGPIRIDGPVTAVLAFEGTATVADRPSGVDVSFAEPRSVTLGLRPSDHGKSRSITVPGTPEGAATALTHASAAHTTTSPVRSDPATRRNPPPIERGEAVAVPDAIRSERTETGIELSAPPDLGTLFVLAPLAYYLGARVSVAPRDAPLLRIPEAGIRRELPSIPELQADAASLLYRTVTLDCLLRRNRNDPGGTSGRRLAAVGIDPDAVAHRGIARRLATYLDAPFREIEPDLPEWHLSAYVTPTPEHVPALAYVLDRLAFVYLPDARRLPDEERLQRSLEDFYRASGETPTVESILPDLNRGRFHAWLADGVAIDAFKLLPEASTTRRSRPGIREGPTEVTLVINDGEMRPEANAIRRIYREARSDPGVDLRIERRLDRDALAATLRRPTDFLHYVGHCDRAGLRCSDGHLDVADLDHSGARVFFLNACGSYHQGVSLVEAGSVAGGVTLRPVLDSQAKRVGTAFARLLTRGFAVERALRIASRRTIMNKDYAVVGDGTYALNTPGDSGRGVAHVSRVRERYRVDVEHGTAHATAAYRQPVIGDDVCLSGTERSVAMSRAELCSFLRGLTLPTVYEGRYYWSSDLRRALTDGDMGE